MATSTRAKSRSRSKTTRGQTSRKKTVRAKVPKRRTSVGKKKKPARKKKLSRQRKPDQMSLEGWQRELRRQFGREQDFALANVGDEPIFSEFSVTNPQSGNTYRVAIRGQQPGENFCSCPDFATNALGTCKHVEFTLAKLERKRGGKAAFRRGFRPAYSQVFLSYGARRVVRFRPGQECPAELARLAGRYFTDEGELRPEAFDEFETFLSQAAEIEHDLRCYEDALSFIAEVRDASRRRERITAAFPDGVHTASLQNLLKVPLYDYQKEGALFAARAGRSLIGDEMGLGKTIQALAATEIMARELGVERVLIICPTSLKHQWEREIEKFTDRTAQVIGGLQPNRRALFETDAFYKITNYDTVHRDLEFIDDLAHDLVILDEAQRIKNWDTRTARAVKQVSSPYCIVLTGTPLENRLEELVSIVQFIDRHRLGPTYRFLHDHQVREETGRVVGYRDLDAIGRTLDPLLIRRQKREVLDQLPQRLEKNFFVPMTPQQQEFHDENREQVAKIVAKWRRFGFLREADQRMLMISLQNMRMSCDSTYLLDQSTDHGVKPDELRTLLGELVETRGAKVVVFSQWTRMHELSIRRFDGCDWEHVFFHGGVPSPKRKQLIDRFRGEGNCRVFLSTDAGGVGLNLQHATAVVNMDLPWNPAVLEQRIGRVHRLGQTQAVQVVNFVSQGTIEEGMLSVLAFKKSLFAGVLDGGETEVFLGGTRLKRFIETVDTVTQNIPAAPPATPEEDALRGSAIDSREAAAPQGPTSATGSDADRQVAADPLSGLLQHGLTLLEELAAAAHSTKTDGKRRRLGSSGPPSKLAGGFFETARDEKTGRPYLKLPMPEPELLDRTLAAVGTLLEGFRR